MNRAYLFPENVKIHRTQAHKATPMDLETEYKTLDQAARHDRLRCTYLECLQPVTPVRREAGSNELRCFAHRPATPESPFCFYRTYKDGDGGPGHHYPPEHNLRKAIENDLRVELQRVFADRGLADVQIESSAYREKEPRIRITGLEPPAPLQIRGLAPGCEALWSEPFAGSVDGEEVLFFFVKPDDSSLRQPFLDDHLLARRPAILVFPAKEGEHKYAIVSRLADSVTAMPFATLDLLRVDYGKLFSLNRAAETLFIPSSYRQVIEKIGARLAVAGLAPEEIKALRLFAKRLLVDGAAIHSSVFGQSRKDAQSFFLGAKTFPPEGLLNTAEMTLLVQNGKLRDFCTGNPHLSVLREKFFANGYTALDNTITSLRKQEAELRTELGVAAANQTATAKKLDVSEAQRKSLESQLADKERAWNKREIEFQALAAAQETSAKLQQEVEEAGKKLATAEVQRATLAEQLAGSEAQRKGLELSLEEAKRHPLAFWWNEHVGHEGSGHGRAN